MASERILIADDDPVICRLLEVNFRLAGFRTETVTSGRAALDSATSDPPDALVLDVMMPGMDGWEVCRVLRDHPDTADLPVVVLSARLWGKDRERGYALGVKGFVAKPFDPADLVSEVRRVLGSDAGEGDGP